MRRSPRNTRSPASSSPPAGSSEARRRPPRTGSVARSSCPPRRNRAAPASGRCIPDESPATRRCGPEQSHRPRLGWGRRVEEVSISNVGRGTGAANAAALSRAATAAVSPWIIRTADPDRRDGAPGRCGTHERLDDGPNQGAHCLSDIGRRAVSDTGPFLTASPKSRRTGSRPSCPPASRRRPAELVPQVGVSPSVVRVAPAASRASTADAWPSDAAK